MLAALPGNTHLGRLYNVVHRGLTTSVFYAEKLLPSAQANARAARPGNLRRYAATQSAAPRGQDAPSHMGWSSSSKPGRRASETENE